MLRQAMLLLAPEGKSRAYISGETWGSKQAPETWKNILKDRKVRKDETVVFVDDSLKKLKGFYEGASAYGANPVAVWLDLKKESRVNLVESQSKAGFSHYRIQSIEQLERIMERVW